MVKKQILIILLFHIILILVYILSQQLLENGLQIVEQILPFFQPEYTVTMNVVPELQLKRDIPIILNSVNYEDTYNGEFTQRRAVIYTLQFTAKTYLYGPMSNQKVIKEVQADLGVAQTHH